MNQTDSALRDVVAQIGILREKVGRLGMAVKSMDAPTDAALLERFRDEAQALGTETAALLGANASERGRG